MKFYDCPQAPSPRRVRICIAEKGLDIDTVDIDLQNGEQFEDWFRRINPDCVVPALELDDGSILTEALAICDYLESLHPEPQLFGSTPAERAHVLEWNTKAEQQGLLAVAEAFRNYARGMRDRSVTGPVSYPQVPELIERGKQRAAQFMQRLDERLAQVEFLAGDAFSMADITALVAVDFAGWMKVRIPEDAAHAQRWYETVSARPGSVA